jgi:outer membrane murein-binding lipoprotein Lpp
MFEKHEVILPIVALIAALIGFLLGVAYQAGCVAQRVEQTSAATSELYNDVKEINSDVGRLQTDVAYSREKSRRVSRRGYMKSICG